MFIFSTLHSDIFLQEIQPIGFFFPEKRMNIPEKNNLIKIRASIKCLGTDKKSDLELRISSVMIILGCLYNLMVLNCFGFFATKPKAVQAVFKQYYPRLEFN